MIINDFDEITVLHDEEHICLLDVQAWLFAGNSADNQLGDIWALDIAKARWNKLSDNADQVKAWHQSHFVATEQVSLSSSASKNQCILGNRKYKDGRAFDCIENTLKFWYQTYHL